MSLFKKNKKKINPFDIIDDFDYDFADSFEIEDYDYYSADDFFEDGIYREDEID